MEDCLVLLVRIELSVDHVLHKRFACIFYVHTLINLHYIFLLGVASWIGSIYGWFFMNFIVQAWCFMIVKLIQFIMLILCIYMLNKLRLILKAALTLKKEAGSEIESAHRKIRNLMICEILLSIFSLVSVIYESYVIINVYQGIFVRNIYAKTTIMSIAAYFPMWTFTHIVLLSYGWISRSKLMVEDNKNLANQIELDMSTECECDSPSDRSLEGVTV